MMLQYYNPFWGAPPKKRTCLLSKNKYALLNLVDYVIEEFETDNQMRETPVDDEKYVDSMWINSDCLYYQGAFRIIKTYYKKLKEEYCWQIDSFREMRGRTKRDFENKIASLEQICSIILFSRQPRPEIGVISSPVSKWATRRIESMSIKEEITFVYK